MDYQYILDSLGLSACIISIEKSPEKKPAKIRIVEGNREYYETMPGFTPGMLYSDLVPEEGNFEYYCRCSAIDGKRMHAYVYVPTMKCWIDSIYLPLKSDDPDYGYCIFILETTTGEDPTRRSNVSIDVARDVIKTCVKLRDATNYAETMADCIGDIREICDADSCALLTVDEDRDEYTLLATKFRDNHTTHSPEQRPIDDGFSAAVRTWPETLGEHDCIIIKNSSDMDDLRKRNPVWVASLDEANVSTLVFFPVKSANKTEGYIWATNFDVDKTVQIKETLELTSFFLGAEISKHNLLMELQRISNIDLLTGIYNRNAMNAYVDRVVNKDIILRNYGVVFADLNGLKKVNDSGGHTAGDALLVEAAQALRRCFPSNMIFRAGGDEFVIIDEKSSMDSFADAVEKLRNDHGETGIVSFAVGSYYADNGKDIRHSMMVADERMYEDKKEYYRKHPESKR